MRILDPCGSTQNSKLYDRPQQAITMKILLILRYAKSRRKSRTLRNYNRPVDELAKLDLIHLGEILEFNHEVPDLIISSSALRAKTTAEPVAEGC